MSLEIWDDDMAEAMEQAEGQQELEEGVLMENIGEMQQELGGLMESFKDFFEGDDISGDPEKDMENWHHQTEQNSCAVACQEFVAEQLLDLLEAGWKRQRPWNRTMVQAREKQMLVTYLSPMLLGLEEPLCQELAERLRDGWNTRRPKDIYNITTYARLQEGFRNVILGIDITGWQKRREEES